MGGHPEPDLKARLRPGGWVSPSLRTTGSCAASCSSIPKTEPDFEVVVRRVTSRRCEPLCAR
jgi:hypothetical protein